MGGAAETFEARVTESDSICPALDLCCFCTTLSVVLLGWEFQPYTIYILQIHIFKHISHRLLTIKGLP